jgi:hypothetical protein
MLNLNFKYLHAITTKYIVKFKLLLHNSFSECQIFLTVMIKILRKKHWLHPLMAPISLCLPNPKRLFKWHNPLRVYETHSYLVGKLKG